MNKLTIFIIVLVVLTLLFISSYLLFSKKHQTTFLVSAIIFSILVCGAPIFLNNIEYHTYDTITTTEKYKVAEINIDGSFLYYDEDELIESKYRNNSNISITVDDTSNKPILEKITTVNKQKSKNKFMDVLSIYDEETTTRYELVLPQTIYDKIYIYKE